MSRAAIDCWRIAPEPTSRARVRVAPEIRRRGEPVDAAQDRLVDRPSGFGGCGVVLVVQRDVVEDVLALAPYIRSIPSRMIAASS